MVQHALSVRLRSQIFLHCMCLGLEGAGVGAEAGEEALGARLPGPRLRWDAGKGVSAFWNRACAEMPAWLQWPDHSHLHQSAAEQGRIVAVACSVQAAAEGD